VDEFTWLHNPTTDGYWQCPAEAVDAWLRRGWEQSEPPPDESTTKDPRPMATPVTDAPVLDVGAAAAADDTPPTTARVTRRTTAAATEEKE